MNKSRGLVITADDFGLHETVNMAVERAHLDGVLTTASLMVAAPAAADAIERAYKLPNLRVGLHLVLADGDSMLDSGAIPDLVDSTGRFSDNMVGAGFRFFFLPYVRAQLAAEIRAQFEAFAATGLNLDHVNTHKHFHLHPTVLRLIIEIGRDYGLQAMRLPFEVGTPFWLRPWIEHVRRRLTCSGIAHNDYVVGIKHTGAMDEAAWLDALRDLPSGVSEFYCHPAIAAPGAELTRKMRGYRHSDELAALVSPRVIAAINAANIIRGGFADLLPVRQSLINKDHILMGGARLRSSAPSRSTRMDQGSSD